MKRKVFSQAELIETIRAALDCPSHFNQPIIVPHKTDILDGFTYGDNAIVICGTCVERMREAIGLREGENNLSEFGYYNYKVVESKKKKSKRRNK